MSRMTPKELEEHRDAFSLFDKTGDGKIEVSEIGEILRALGTNPTQAEVAKICKEIDPTGERRISFEEFLPLFNAQCKKKMPGDFEHFADVFRIFDREGNAMVQAAEIRNLLGSLGERLTSHEVDVLVQGMEDSNGLINYEEFVRDIMSG